MNQSTTMAGAKIEALVAVDKLVATTTQQQTVTDNNQLRQWWACRIIGMPARHCWGERGASMLRCWWGGSGALVVVRDDGGSRCAVALLGQQQHYRGMRGVAGMGQRAWRCRGRREAASGLKRKVIINMLLGGACGKGRGRRWHGVHHGWCPKQRPLHQQSAAAVFFARMEIVLQQQGGDCGNKGDDNGGDNDSGDVVDLAVSRAGLGPRNQSMRWGAWTR
jgi:hypothetical protein